MIKMMSFVEAQETFESYWNRAKKLDYVVDKVSWALFQTLIEAARSKEALQEAVYHEALPCITRQMEKDIDDQKWDSGCWLRYKMFERLLEELPSVEQQPGKWIVHDELRNVYGGECIECPECGERYVVQNITDEKFCRKCGARMCGTRMEAQAVAESEKARNDSR